MTADLLAGLDEQQREAAETLLGPVCILAGAGTGKTRALTHRIAHGVATGVYAPDRVMALTFTTRAAGELRARLRRLGAEGVAARTFHAAALSQLSYFWPQLVGGRTPELISGKARLLGHAAESLRMRVDTAVLRDLAAEIEWRKVRRMSLAEYERQARANRVMPTGLSVEAVLELQQRYEDLKDERRQIDFEDVLLITAGMIDAEPRVAEQVREQYRFFVVDEFQDVSPLQHDLLQLWLGPRTDLCVVGDASQTIYSFAGASSDYLLGFGSRYPDAAVVRLETNYRSSPGVLAAANRLMRGRPGALELTPATPGDSSEPVVTRWGTDAEEAAGVADAIAQQIASGIAPETIAVLYRVNAQSAALESALAARGISARQLGGTRFFDLDVIKRAVLELMSLARTGSRKGMYETVADVAMSIGWTVDPPETQGAVRERWEALNALVELADGAPKTMTLVQFVAELRERQSTQHEPTMSSVVLSTFHGAKGLEWDHVHLVGLSEGLLPISHAKGFDAIDEERRLLYVGITRARRTLAMHWASEGLRSRPREPSRFLAELRSGIPGGARSARS